MSVPTWAQAFLKHYQRPQKPSVEAAYEQFKQLHQDINASVCPSIHAVRRWLKNSAHRCVSMGAWARTN